MFCPHCAVTLVEEARYCHHCGTRVARERHDAEPDAVFHPYPADEGDRVEPPAAATTLGPAAAGGDADEHELWEGGFTPRAMFASVAAALGIVAFCLVASVLALVRGSYGAFWAFLVVLALAVLVELSRIVKRCASVHYRLSNRRLFLETGCFSRHKEQLELARVDDVRVRQNLFDRFFDVGSVEVLSHDRRLRRVVLEGISAPDQLAEAIRLHARRLRDPRPLQPGVRIA